MYVTKTKKFMDFHLYMYTVYTYIYVLSLINVFLNFV